MGLDWAAGLAAAGLIAVATSAYVYRVVRPLPLGWPRLAASLPVFPLYIFTPWLFDPTTHCIGTALLYCALTWLASFRLLTLCWGYGPAADPSATQNLLRFHAALALPINLKQTSTVSVRSLKRKKGKGLASLASASNGDLGLSVDWRSTPPGALAILAEVLESDSWPVLLGRCCLKMLVLGSLCGTIAHKDTLSPLTLNLLNSVQVFLLATIVEEGLAAGACLVSGVELEPHFDQPYLASSLEDFWAHRWNLTVSTCLREIIYLPVLHLLTKRPLTKKTPGARDVSEGNSAGSAGERSEPITGSHVALSSGSSSATTEQGVRLRPGKAQPSASTEDRADQTCEESTKLKQSSADTFSNPQTANPAAARSRPPPWARLVAMLAVFFVSGVMHELALFYLTSRLTGEMTAFFTIHGVATGAEVALKRMLRGKVQLPRVVSTCLTLSFLLLTGQWLFFAPLLRLGIDERVNGHLCKLVQTSRGVFSGS